MLRVMDCGNFSWKSNSWETRAQEFVKHIDDKSHTRLYRASETMLDCALILRHTEGSCSQPSTPVPLHSIT